MNMKRRDFLAAMAAAGAGAAIPGAWAAGAAERRALVLVELRGGNDGLNTVVPYASDAYYRLRPGLAIPREDVLPLDPATGLHPSLAPLMGAWRRGELAIVQGVGMPGASLSHFRAVEIWNTALADEYLAEDWVSRSGAAPIVDLEAASFGAAARDAAARIAASDEVSVLRIALGGFDTHAGQAATHAALLAELAGGLTALRSALVAAQRWRSTVVMTCSEFGRQPQENALGGTDHGTVNAHFVLGGRVRGGLHGTAPDLDALDDGGGLPHGVDFRRLYATVLERWWGVDATTALRARFAPLDLLPV